ncbi:MAG: phosphatase PAP2 family protein [Candidatus Hermodarchaeota archaeon]
MENINRLFYSIIALWTILAIIFGIFDLEISKYVTTYGDSKIFEFGNEYGDDVNLPLFYVGITIVLGSIFNDLKMQRKIGLIMILYSFSYLEYLLITSEGFYYSGDIFASTATLVSLAIFLILAYNKNWRNYITIGISLILLYIFANLIVHILKFTWGRVRFNDLSSDSDFTPWYVINQGNPENDSFPSGHTSSAFTFLPLLMLTKNKNMSKKLKVFLIFSIVGFGMYVALGRVVVGRHYASDVLFSAGICSILTISFYKLLQIPKFSFMFNIGNINNDLAKIHYSDLTNQWLGYHYNENGRKIWKWFNSYDEALKYSNPSNTFL